MSVRPPPCGCRFDVAGTVGNWELCALHAAASELLDACKRLLRFNEELAADVHVSMHYPSADAARKAIARAEGRQP